jgi:hypothetical protein
MDAAPGLSVNPVRESRIGKADVFADRLIPDATRMRSARGEAIGTEFADKSEK